MRRLLIVILLSLLLLAACGSSGSPQTPPRPTYRVALYFENRYLELTYDDLDSARAVLDLLATTTDDTIRVRDGREYRYVIHLTHFDYARIL